MYERKEIKRHGGEKIRKEKLMFIYAEHYRRGCPRGQEAMHSKILSISLIS